MEDFPNASAYCQRLKVLADQLKNVGAPVSNNRLVLQMVAGLTEAYKNIGTLLRQSNPLPPFYEARSSLCLEEKGLANSISTASAMVAAREVDDASDNYSHHNNHNRNNGGKKGNNKNYGNKNRGGGRGGGGGKGGSNRSGGGGGGGQQHSGQQVPQWFQAVGQQQPWSWPFMPWAIPPCPYPTSSWARPNAPRHAGILGSRPQQQQVYSAAVQPTPTDIEAAMHTLGLTPPDPNWYMDTGATSHMTSGQDGDASNEM
ncbi:la-related protein CG11505-like isoform X2 [Asparagus officinalis]|uniref:la-related protein CG11505-like isoform X2 n=1 Tax=Asparagus officinalis TaxID=4686 RepID=UPI00098E7CB3|nr:la-related protein CG11505-like isoform X2 [Asparagus officinalis]XP_020250560.1 la-related protein CG11505-like isoform X2 [Asparagus officinalis]XP_020251085.1 la-related protein CG11505-like isoform X2 [Asparagus officinalis]XP_020252072.1 la-related protein CG11505-like isoform X2 [Asparagus officinalis]XP_020268715.1 la-related protein CG11505-like isoform X2 [Asparagus officinalis]